MLQCCYRDPLVFPYVPAMPPARRKRGQARRGGPQARPQLRPRRSLLRPRRLRDDALVPPVDRPAAPSSDSEPEEHVETEAAVIDPPAQPQEVLPDPAPQPEVARVVALEEALQRQEQQISALMVGVGLPHHQPPPHIPAALGAPPRTPPPAGGPPPLLPAAAGAPVVAAAPVPQHPVPQQASQPQPDPLMAQIVGAAVAGNQILPEHLNLGYFLPQDITTAITSKQYVDLTSLSNDPSPSSAVVFSFDTSKPNPQLSLKKPVKFISNFREWMSLFATYASVYTTAFPHEAPALFTYMVKIYQLSQEGGYVWRSYDEAFRKLKAKYPSVLYQEHNPHLLNTLRHNETVANNNRSLPQMNHQRGKPATPPAPTNACHRFFFRGSCSRTPCPYNHICGHCHSSGHSRFKCLKSPPSSSNISSKRT